MQAFSTLLGSLGQNLGVGSGTLGKIVGAGYGATGLGGLIEQFQMANKQKSVLDRQLYYMKHPEALSALVSKMTKPLDQGLIKGVGNVVQAEAGERGLSGAPGVYQQILAQSLAPYQQQNQQTALQEAMASLGLGSDLLSQKPTDMSSWLSTILPKQSSQLPGPGSSPPGLSVPLDLSSIFGTNPEDLAGVQF